MATIVFTGLRGFLGVELLARVLRAAPDERAVCVVQSRYAALAEQKREDGRFLGRFKGSVITR